jgi:prepilin peptidase CpaA
MDALAAGAATGLGTIAAIGAYLDLRYRRLPNWLCAIALAAGLILVPMMAGWGDLQSSLLHAFIALAIGIGLFALGSIGAGDAKFYAALAAWFPLRDGFLLIGAVSLAGLALLIAWLPWRVARRRRLPSPVDGDLFDKLPYGVAIALGAVIAFVLTHHFGGWPMLRTGMS